MNTPIQDYLAHPMFRRVGLGTPNPPVLGPMMNPMGPMDYLKFYRPGQGQVGQGGGGNDGGGNKGQPWGPPGGWQDGGNNQPPPRIEPPRQWQPDLPPKAPPPGRVPPGNPPGQPPPGPSPPHKPPPGGGNAVPPAPPPGQWQPPWGSPEIPGGPVARVPTENRLGGGDSPVNEQKFGAWKNNPFSEFWVRAVLGYLRSSGGAMGLPGARAGTPSGSPGPGIL